MRTLRVRYRFSACEASHREALCAAKNLVLSAKELQDKVLWLFCIGESEVRTIRVRHREALCITVYPCIL